MRSAIATIMAILGTVLVLSGAAAFWAMALHRPATADPDPGPPAPVSAGSGAGEAPVSTVSVPAPVEPSRFDRTVGTLARVPTPDRLILWGVLLLGLSAVAAGAISVSATATAGN